jgi:hypothetical protein
MRSLDTVRRDDLVARLIFIPKLPVRAPIKTANL